MRETGNLGYGWTIPNAVDGHIKGLAHDVDRLPRIVCGPRQFPVLLILPSVNAHSN
jgi:hypothetical protein